MTKEQDIKIKSIITEMVISESDCRDCEHYDINPKRCERCELRGLIKLNKLNRDYINEKVKQIKTVSK